MSQPALKVFDCPLEGITLIEASAGTGKTWNLCGLYLRLLLEKGLLVDQILVVTFTRAATAELRERIRHRLQDALLALALPADGNDPFIDGLFASLAAAGLFDPAVLRTRLADALLNFDLAAITTIHGFCQRALADLPFAAGQPFDLALHPDDSALVHETAADFWRAEVVARISDAGCLRYLAEHGLKPDALAGQIRRRAAKPLAKLIWPPPETAAPPDSSHLALAFEAARQAWQREAEPMRDWLLAQYKGRLHGASYKPDSIAQSFDDWQQHFAAGHPHAALGDKHALLTRARIIEKTTGKQPALEHPLFDTLDDYANLRNATRQAFETTRQTLLQRALSLGVARLREKKAAARQLAYDDLLTYLHHALSGENPPGLAQRLQERFPAALIDEFQDTDPLQFGIFRHIYAAPGQPRGPLFLIGDPKQAIYGFRNADIFTYLNARTIADRQATLGENQRATPALITAVNTLFLTNPAAFALPDFPPFSPVTVGARPRTRLIDPQPAAGDLILWHFPLDEAGNAPPRHAARQGAVNACAAEIARLLADGVQLADAGGHHRPIAAGDMAILVRSHRQGAAMKAALGMLGIGSIELSQASVFQSEEASELQILLNAVADPGRADLVLAALATRLIGKQAPEIARLAARDAPDLAHHQQAFLDYRHLLEQRGFAVFWRRFADDFELAGRYLRLPDGERRLTNLNHLAELTQEADSQLHGAKELRRWLDHACTGDDSRDVAQLRLESDANLVQIVTVHKSKGLEYPVVFAPFLWDMNAGAGSSSLEGREYHDPDGELCIDFRPDADKQSSRREDFAEQVRLIYVALTRAVNRAYLVVGPYTQRVGRGSPGTTQSARGILNWLVATGEGHTPDDWLQNKADARQIEQAWQAFAASMPAGAATLNPLPASPAGALLQQTAPAATLLAPALPGLNLPVWRSASFSSLNQTGHASQEIRPDHDALAAGRAAGQDSAIAPDDILRFPRGAAAGEIIHAVLEKVDFQHPEHWDAAIARALANDVPESQAQPMSRMLRSMLEQVMHTALPEGFCLADIATHKRIAELEFCLPCKKLTAASLNALLARHHIDQQDLGFRGLSGYLGGFIDLVFTHGERYYLADWKSNYLGSTPESYGPAPLAEAMRSHGYHLQYLLYTLALHRHLGRHLPGYQYESHFGGAYYFFIRGMRPAWQQAGQSSGIFFSRPPLALIQALDALIG